MRIAAIIAEYNPFHFGHQWQMEEARRILGDDTAILVVLSGHFVQRGEPALLSKYCRARLAIEEGADLVLELPSLFSGAAAGFFARAAVQILGATGLPLTLVCGREIDRYEELHRVADLLLEEPPEWKQLLHHGLDQGLSYATARAEATSLLLARRSNSSEDPSFYERELCTWREELKRPNNILAIEYLLARERFGLKKQIRTLLLPRRGQEEDQENWPGESWPSASALRLRLQDARSPSQVFQAIAGHLPARSLAALARATQEQTLYRPDDLSAPIFSNLLSRSPAEIDEIDGMEEGLGRRLQNLLHEEGPSIRTWSDLVRRAQGKRFPATRVRRAGMNLLLGLQRETALELRQQGPGYLRPLAASPTGRYLLRRLRDEARLPLIARASDFLEQPQTSALRQQGELELLAGNLLALSHGQPLNLEFQDHLLLLKPQRTRLQKTKPSV